jgi:hypothetical protein
VKVKVYHFRWWDGFADEWKIPPRKSTIERIAKECRGEIIEGAEEEVDMAQLDDYGRYDPLPLAADVQRD